jgi:hypothetical protein
MEFNIARQIEAFRLPNTAKTVGRNIKVFHPSANLANWCPLRQEFAVARSNCLPSVWKNLEVRRLQASAIHSV